MRQEVHRSLTMLDAIVLVAATAVGMAGARQALMRDAPGFTTPNELLSVLYKLGMLSRALRAAECFLAV
jgi:hypothetical protein